MSFEIINKIDENDNVAIANVAIMKGDVIPLSDKTITAKAEIPEGSILALDDIKKGEYIIRYGFKAGMATADIEHGESLSAYNYTTKLDDIESLCVALSANHKAYISQKEDSVKDYSLRIGAYKTDNSIGLLKAVAIIAHENYSSLASSLSPNAIIVKDDNEAMLYLKHPNLAQALVLGCNITPSNSVVVLKDPNRDDAINALQQLEEKAKEIKKTSFPLSALTVEIYGFDKSPSYNHMIGKLVDDLICLGANVIVDITTPLGTSLQLIKEKLVDKKAEAFLPPPANNKDIETELNFIQLLGKGEIATVITTNNECQKGLNLCFEPTFTYSQIILDLTGNLKATALSPILNLKSNSKGNEISVESLLFDINRIISKNR